SRPHAGAPGAVALWQGAPRPKGGRMKRFDFLRTAAIDTAIARNPSPWTRRATWIAAITWFGVAALHVRASDRDVAAARSALAGTSAAANHGPSSQAAKSDLAAQRRILQRLTAGAPVQVGLVLLGKRLSESVMLTRATMAECADPGTGQAGAIADSAISYD